MVHLVEAHEETPTDELSAAAEPWRPEPVSRGRRLRALVIVALLAVALLIRAGEVQRTSYRPIGDARSYLALGQQIAQSGDYSRLDRGAGGSAGPTAYFPPAYPYLLAATNVLDGQPATGPAAVHVDRLVEAVLGTVVVGVIGLLAFELLGADAALAAIAIAAVFPPLVELSGVLVAENLLVVLELAAVYAAVRARGARDPVRWLIATGVFTGLAALTHVNGILLAIPLLVAVRGTRPVLGRRQVTATGIFVVSLLMTLSPWLIRDAAVMHRFVPISDETGMTLAGTYNPSSQAATDPPDKWLPYRNVQADRRLAREAAGLTEPQLDARLTSRALSYIAHHPGAPFVTAAHNVLRLAELEGEHTWRASAAAVGIDGGTAEIGVIGFWVLAVLAALATTDPRVRRLPPWIWAVPLIMLLSAVFINAETPRFREPIDPFLILMVAAPLARALGWGRERFLNWQYARRQ